MGRYTGPACKICRRLGMKLFLKGDRCYMAKCPIETGDGVCGGRLLPIHPLEQLCVWLAGENAS